MARPATPLGQCPRIVYVPTGPYDRVFERRLADADFLLGKVNPRQARRFAEATGRLAKTDRLDAAMLARMGALLELEARPVRRPILRRHNTEQLGKIQRQIAAIMRNIMVLAIALLRDRRKWTASPT